MEDKEKARNEAMERIYLEAHFRNILLQHHLKKMQLTSQQINEYQCIEQKSLQDLRKLFVEWERQVYIEKLVEL